ncbi:MAG: hypothetical protein Q9184_001610 [Pyrenodesmia sp. 2 TL-2023]
MMACTALKADTANEKMTFGAKANCYFYTTFPALYQKASTDGLTGNNLAITTPFTQWPDANPASVKSFVFGDFSSTGTWEIGHTNLMCPAASGGSSSVIVTSSVGSSTTSKVSMSAGTASSTAPRTCTDLLIDDWSSQSRLTFLFYNAMFLPSSDNGTMASIVVADNHVTLTKMDSSYFNSILGCTSATDKYGGIGLTINAAAGTALQVGLQTNSSCDLIEHQVFFLVLNWVGRFLDPRTLAHQVLEAVNAANIKVSFFTVGAPILDSGNNLTSVYKEMLGKGHQMAYHSFTHPPMEGLPSYAAIDSELTQAIDAVQKTLNEKSQPPSLPHPLLRALPRLLTAYTGKLPSPYWHRRCTHSSASRFDNSSSKFVGWSIDVEDSLWALSTTPKKQLETFERDLARGGNLVVMHYLYPTTVQYLPQFIALAKAAGKGLMRVDQRIADPEAPPLWLLRGRVQGSMMGIALQG